jgi:hypothetical protein
MKKPDTGPKNGRSAGVGDRGGAGKSGTLVGGGT